MSEEVFYADIELTDENFYLRFWTRDDETNEEKSYDWLIEDLLYEKTERQKLRGALEDAKKVIKQCYLVINRSDGIWDTPTDQAWKAASAFLEAHKEPK
jgi:hypothetical protein